MIRNLMPQILVFAIFAVLFLCQPDLGSTLLLAAILLIALFLSGLSLKYMFVAILLVTPLGLLAVMHRSYRIRRVLGWLNPLQFKQDIGYQLSESWMTIGSGGWFGQGLGNGNYKLMFLPEAHTDFIFAAIGAELGFVGMIAVILVFVTFLFKGLLISLGQKDLFNFYLGFLIVSLISLQAAVNIAVVTGVLPTKGFTLPLISYGGSSLWANCFMVGILLNLSRRKSEKSSSKLNQSERIPSYG